MTNLCSPSTMCGPFCSVPAVPTITLVVPRRDQVADLGPRQVFDEHRVGRLARRRRRRRVGRTLCGHRHRENARRDKSLPTVRAFSCGMNCIHLASEMWHVPFRETAVMLRCRCSSLRSRHRLRLVGSAEAGTPPTPPPADRAGICRAVAATAVARHVRARRIFPGAAARSSSCRSRAGSSPRAIRSTTSCTDRRGITTCASRSCSTARRS